MPASRFFDTNVLIYAFAADIHSEAVELARDNAFSFYDSLVIAAAADAGCRVLLSEDAES